MRPLAMSRRRQRWAKWMMQAPVLATTWPCRTAMMSPRSWRLLKALGLSTLSQDGTTRLFVWIPMRWAGFRLRDGGGLHSDADWWEPRCADILGDLRRCWLGHIDSWGLVPRVLQALRSPSDDSWLDDSEIQVLREDVLSFLKNHGYHSSACVTPGQPLTLDFWRDLFAMTGDIDTSLIPLLSHRHQ